MDKFIEMERSGNSYIRTRGLVLIACNAKWDVDGKIDRMIDEYLEHVTDERPICVRQCIKLLPLIAEAKPALVSKIVSALRDVNVACYADSMRPLIQNDIRDSLLAIEGQGSEYGTSARSGSYSGTRELDLNSGFLLCLLRD